LSPENTSYSLEGSTPLTEQTDELGQWVKRCEGRWPPWSVLGEKAFNVAVRFLIHRVVGF
jgi:hypothetical protein